MINCIDMKGIGKSFFATRALDNINFSCVAGEVHAFFGLNGADKSTLIDKSTSGLSDKDKERLFGFIRRMKEAGVVIIYVSHYVREIFGIAEEVTVMRDDKIVLSKRTSQTTEDAVYDKADIYRIIEDLATRGIGVLIRRYEIDEVIMLADRVISMCDGRSVPKYAHPNFNKDKMLADMSGANLPVTMHA